MKSNCKWTTLLVLIAGGLIGAMAVGLAQPPSAAGGGKLVGHPRYHVVHSEGSNLIATDNHSNMLYFYSIDKDQEVGAELKLRGTIELERLGAPIIRPTTTKKKD
jgi:hypothetical protein